MPPVKLIAVAGEHLGHEEWYAGGQYWSGALFFDVGKQGLFKTMGAGRQGLLSGTLSYLMGGAVRTNSDRCDAKQVTGNMEGEGLKLGGVWVLTPDGNIAYEHKENTWGDTVQGARLQELKVAVAGFARGPPDLM